VPEPPTTTTRTRARTEPATEHRAADAEAGREQERPPVCTVAFCPICMAVTAAQGGAPDAVDHLLRAAREFFLAARALVDQRADDLAGEGRSPTRLEKIEIA
jgi:hypothetical protein